MPYMRMPPIYILEVVGKSGKVCQVLTWRSELWRLVWDGGGAHQVEAPHFGNGRRTGIQKERAASLWALGGLGGSM